MFSADFHASDEWLSKFAPQVVDASPVLNELRILGSERYET